MNFSSKGEATTPRYQEICQRPTNKYIETIECSMLFDESYRCTLNRDGRKEIMNRLRREFSLCLGMILNSFLWKLCRSALNCRADLAWCHESWRIRDEDIDELFIYLFKSIELINDEIDLSMAKTTKIRGKRCFSWEMFSKWSVAPFESVSLVVGERWHDWWSFSKRHEISFQRHDQSSNRFNEIIFIFFFSKRGETDERMSLLLLLFFYFLAHDSFFFKANRSRLVDEGVLYSFVVVCSSE